MEKEKKNWVIKGKERQVTSQIIEREGGKKGERVAMKGKGKDKGLLM